MVLPELLTASLRQNLPTETGAASSEDEFLQWVSNL